MFYYLYQITNLVNNKIYVGVHKTNKMNDGYMGSGKVIKSAIEKYGIENFKKDILETFENSESMYAREKEIVTEEFLSRDDVYNLRRGGYGGFEYINKNPEKFLTEKRLNALSFPPDEAIKILKEKYKNDPVFRQERLLNAEKARQKAKLLYPQGPFKGKKHTEEFKKKIGQITSLAQSGEKNSQYGTMWITDGTNNLKIKKTDLIPTGWKKGRKLK